MSTWDLALENENSREGKGETSYVKFQDGNNQMRILDAEPKAVWVHWLSQANNGKGLSVVCLGKNCPMCEKLRYDKANNVQTRDRIQRQFVINVYNRATQRVELLQKGKTIFETLATFHKSMGDITGYDINIVKTGRGLDTRYTVIPVMQSEPVPQGLELYNLDEVTKVFERPMVDLLMSGMSIEDAQKTFNADAGNYTSGSDNNSEDIGVEDGNTTFAPF